MAKKQPLIERFQKLAGIKPLYEQLKENSISRLKDMVKDMSEEDFTTLVKKVGDYEKWKNASKGKFDDGTPIRPFSNAGDRVEVIDNNFEEKDAEKYLGDEDLRLEPEDGEYVDEVELDDLDFETLKAAFPKFYQKVKFTRTQPNGEEGQYYEDAISFPNLDDSSTVIGDSSALEDWKDKVSRRFGNVEIVFNDEAKNSFDRVFVSDDAFNDARDGFIRGKMSAMQGDMDKGRSID